MRMPLFRGTKQRMLVFVVGAVLSSLLFSACGGSTSILNTDGPVAESESFIFWVILGIAGVIFVGVEAMLIYSAWRFRERPGMPAPRQLHGNTTLEFAWTAAPAFVLLIVLVFTIRGLWQVAPENRPTTGKTEVVEAIGHQWWWEFYYPSYNITTADTLHVPVGETIQVELYSNNVIHSFWIPALTGKTDVIPGHANTRWFVANKAGVYEGLCADFVVCSMRICGLMYRPRVVLISLPGLSHNNRQRQPRRQREVWLQQVRLSLKPNAQLAMVLSVWIRKALSIHRRHVIIRMERRRTLATLDQI